MSIHSYRGVDFNAVWNPADDRTCGSENRDQELASSALQALAKGLGLTDMWHLTNPSVKDYSLFST